MPDVTIDPGAVTATAPTSTLPVDGAADNEVIESREAGWQHGWSRAHTVLLLAVLAIGIAMRLYSMVAFPFDQDELYTLMESRDLFDTRLQPGIEARPLYYLIQHPFLELSQSEIGLRVLPTLFGILGLIVTAIAAVRMVGPLAGLAAVAFAALSPWHLYASGTARYFSLVYLLSAVLAWRLPIAIDGDRRRDFVFVLLVLVAGTATHPTFAIPAAGVALAVTLVNGGGTVGWHWPSRRAWAWLWLPYAAFLVAAYAALSLTGNESAVRNWSGRGLAATLRLVPAIVEWATLPVVALSVAGAFLLFAVDGPRRRVGAMAIMSALVTVMLLFVMSFSTDVYADYAIGMLPLALIAAGGAVQLMYERLGASRWLGAMLVTGIVIAGGLPSTVSYLFDGLRFDYRPAFERIVREAPDDPVLAWPVAIQRHYAPQLESLDLQVSPGRRDRLLETSGQAWAVVSVKRHGIAADDDGVVASWLADRCRRVESYERPRLDYRMYRVELWRCNRDW